MWKTPLTISTPLDLEGVGSKRVEFGPHGDRVFHYNKFGKRAHGGEMIENIGVSVVSQHMNRFGWVQYRGYCPFAKVPKFDGGNISLFPPGLGLIDDNLTISMPGDVQAIPKDRQLFDIIDYEKTNNDVEKLFNRRWKANAKRNGFNRPDMTGKLGIKEYADTLYNKSVILIGAGPSLKKNIKYLKKNKIIKVAMLHALPLLEKEGIAPDFVVHTDAMSTDSVFVTKNSKDITLIANIIVAPNVLRKWKGGIRFYGGIPASKLTKDVLGMAKADSLITPMGCSMGAALYIFDKIFNAQNFIFVGNDLAFSDKGETHCWDGQSISTHELAGVNHFIIKNELTGKLYETCYQFSLYKHNLESYIKDRLRTTRKRYINATEGGILILNEEMTLTKAIEEFDYE